VDTCSRLIEPGGVEWNVNVNHSPQSTDLSPKVHPAMGGILFSFEPVRLSAATGGGEVPAGADMGGVAPDHPGDADVGGPGSEIAQLRQENERLRMERDIMKKSIAILAGART